MLWIFIGSRYNLQKNLSKHFNRGKYICSSIYVNFSLQKVIKIEKNNKYVDNYISLIKI